MSAPNNSHSNRLISIDVMRGLVMVLMALDHVRVYSGVPGGGPTYGVFFTRWVTHFCAPAFVFLAGTSAFFLGRKLNDNSVLARYLVIRGLILVMLELTLIRFFWTFNVDYTNWILAGVIWMLGWCMVLLALLIWLPTWARGTFGLVMITFQQAFGLVPRLLTEAQRNSFGWVWEFIYSAGLEPPQPLNILYVIVPWIGVMAVGYAFGAIMTRPADERRRLCLKIGLSAIGLFLIGGSLLTFVGDAPDNAPPALIRLLNQEKYPPSQLFLLMTLGPMIALLPLTESARRWFGKVLTTFGRVPLFYYMLHIPVIHVVCLLVWYLRDRSFHSEYFATAPYVFVPPEHRWSLLLLYLVFFIILVLLYFPCRWFERLKSHRKTAWLRYL